MVQMNFKDFSPEELVGKTVLWETRSTRRITKISRVLKTGFCLECDEKIKFKFNGHEKNDDKWYTSFCRLITPEEEIEIRKQFKFNNYKRKIIDGLSKVEFSEVVLSAMENLIEKGNLK